MIAGSIGPSHAHVHVRSVDRPVRIFALAVAPGDPAHADRHGALVVPPEVIPGLAGAIRRLQAVERVILAPARAGFSGFAAFEAAWAAFEAART